MNPTIDELIGVGDKDGIEPKDMDPRSRIIRLSRLDGKLIRLLRKGVVVLREPHIVGQIVDIVDWDTSTWPDCTDGYGYERIPDQRWTIYIFEEELETNWGDADKPPYRLEWWSLEKECWMPWV